jgi:IclR family transcriptional regulator, pca regulon regulatory protein
VLLAALDPGQVAAVIAEPSRAGLPPFLPRDPDEVARELMMVRARGWALADEELAPGIRSIAVPVRDGTGAVRAAMNVTVHAAETTVETLIEAHLPRLLRAAGEVSADWAWQSRPQADLAPDGKIQPAAG